MLPEWMTKTDSYVASPDGGAFAVKTIRALGGMMARLKIQKGHEKPLHLPALFKLLLLLFLILFVSITQSRLLLMAVTAVVLVVLCTWPAKDLLSILQPSAFAALLALILFLPAMILKPSGIANNVFVVMKVFLSMTMLGIFNHTTQWNHITGALRKLHIPGLFVFTLDITLKYMVLLGNLIQDLLTSLLLRSVGKNNKKYTSIGGIMGITFLRGSEMNKQMVEAMQCRGFTDDYKGL